MSALESLAVVIERLKNLQFEVERRYQDMKNDVNDKHTQNRDDIHGLKNDFQAMSNQIWLIKIKLAGYSAVGGILTAIVIKLLDHYWH